jgi:hypothetical protein
MFILLGAIVLEVIIVICLVFLIERDLLSDDFCVVMCVDDGGYTTSRVPLQSS